MDDPGALSRVHLVVEGRVQGVFYRASTVQEARLLGLSGWVRNRRDGAVELEAEGPRPTCDALVDWCRRGPPLAHVTHIEITWLSPAGTNEAFHVRATA